MNTMKKIILAILVIFAVGCKSKEQVVGTKLDRSTEIAIKGNWVLSSVSYEGSDYIKVTSFAIADSKCFEGSGWSFVANNNKGKMALNNANCSSYASDITWYINKEGKKPKKKITIESYEGNGLTYGDLEPGVSYNYKIVMTYEGKKIESPVETFTKEKRRT